MDFKTQDAEKAYKTIVNSSGIGFYEIISRPKEYAEAFRQNDELRPEDLDRNDQGLRALEMLEEAGLVMENGSIHSYEVIEDAEVYDEVFDKLEDKREVLV